jgi:hypothetical protein
LIDIHSQEIFSVESDAEVVNDLVELIDDLVVMYDPR